MVKNFMMMAALVAFPTLMAAPVEAKDKEYCREYTKTISIGGRSERAYGTACYRPDGSWEVVSLEGSYRAQNDIREVIYKDIHKKKTRGGQTIIIQNRTKPYSHVPRYRHGYERVIYKAKPSYRWSFYERDDHHRKLNTHRGHR